MARKTVDVMRDRKGDALTMVRPAELADAKFSDRSLADPPSARAWKFFGFLLSHAGGSVHEDRYHELWLADLNRAKGLRNLSFAEAEELAEELRRTTMIVGITGELTADGLIGATKRPLDSTARKAFRWRFGESLREAFSVSEIWALLERQAVMAMTSRYALRLYEIAALRGGLEHKTAETFSIDEIRQRLGVPTGKLRTWDQLRRRAIEPAVAEVSQLTRYSLTATPVKTGRSVSAVTLTWSVKKEITGVRNEIGRHSAGRKARREGTVEHLEVVPETAQKTAKPPPFPEIGGIRYADHWAAIARENAPGWDVDVVAERFRGWWIGEGRKLSVKGVEKAFSGFARQMGPLK